MLVRNDLLVSELLFLTLEGELEFFQLVVSLPDLTAQLLDSLAQPVDLILELGDLPFALELVLFLYSTLGEDAFAASHVFGRQAQLNVLSFQLANLVMSPLEFLLLPDQIWDPLVLQLQSKDLVLQLLILDSEFLVDGCHLLLSYFQLLLTILPTFMHHPLVLLGGCLKGELALDFGLFEVLDFGYQRRVIRHSVGHS